MDLPDFSKRVTDEYVGNSINKLVNNHLQGAISLADPIPSSPSAGTKRTTVVSSESEMDPTWEFDLMAGKITQGDILTDERGNLFYTTGNQLTPLSNESGSKLAPLGTLTPIVTAAKEEPQVTRPMPNKGLMSYIEASGQASTYKPLTYKAMENIQSLLDRETENMRKMLNSQGAQILIQPRRYGKSMMAGEQAIQQFIAPNPEHMRLLDLKSNLYSDEISYDMNVKDRFDMLMNVVGEMYEKGFITAQQWQEQRESLQRWRLRREVDEEFAPSSTITNRYSISIDPLTPSPGGGLRPHDQDKVKRSWKQLIGWKS